MIGGEGADLDIFFWTTKFIIIPQTKAWEILREGKKYSEGENYGLTDEAPKTTDGTKQRKPAS
jgi:hypothetical protein